MNDAAGSTKILMQALPAGRGSFVKQTFWKRPYRETTWETTRDGSPGTFSNYFVVLCRKIRPWWFLVFFCVFL